MFQEKRANFGRSLVERPPRGDSLFQIEPDTSINNMCNGQNFKNYVEDIKTLFSPDPQFHDFPSFFAWIDNVEFVCSSPLLLLDFTSNTKTTADY